MLTSFFAAVCLFVSARAFAPLSGPLRATTLALSAKSKTSPDKVRVRLVADVKDTGRKGEIVMVSSALWSNVLMPKKQAVRVSDEELSQLEQQERSRVEKELEVARSIQADLSAKKALTFSRKVGPNRQLFGAVTVKQIIEQLRATYAALSAKASIESIVAEDVSVADSLVNGEIRKSGTYRVKVILHPQVSASFGVEVVPEK